MPVQDAALDPSPSVIRPEFEPTLVAEDEIGDLPLVLQHTGAELYPLIFLLVGEGLDNLRGPP